MDLTTTKPVAYVYVTDRERALTFYRESLGLELHSSDPFGDFIALDQALLRMTVIADHQPSPHPVLGFMVADIDANVASLQDRGVTFMPMGEGPDAPPVWTAPDGRTKVAFFSDADGNVLTLGQY